MSNRREFFAAASGGMALAALGSPAFAGGADPVSRYRGGMPVRAVFEGLQGHDFGVRDGAGARAVLRLEAVQTRPAACGVEQFSLVLRGDAGRPLEGGLYRFDHAATGRFQLRVDPAGGSQDGAVYRAELSLLV